MYAISNYLNCLLIGFGVGYDSFYMVIYLFFPDFVNYIVS